MEKIEDNNLLNNRNNGVYNGILFAAIAIALSLILYVYSKALFMNPSLRVLFSFAIPIFFMSRAAVQERKKMDGYISFTEALQPAYMCLIIGSLGFAIFQFVILSMDFELLQIQRDIAVESMQLLSEMVTMPEENIATFEDMTAEDLRPNFRSFMLGIAKNFILGFIIAALIAAIVKRKNLASE